MEGRTFRERTTIYKEGSDRVGVTLTRGRRSLTRAVLRGLYEKANLQKLYAVHPMSKRVVHPVLYLDQGGVTRCLGRGGVSRVRSDAGLSSRCAEGQVERRVLPVLRRRIGKGTTTRVTRATTEVSRTRRCLARRDYLILNRFRGNGRCCFARGFFVRPRVVRICTLRRTVRRLTNEQGSLTTIRCRGILRLCRVRAKEQVDLPCRVRTEESCRKMELYQCKRRGSTKVVNRGCGNSSVRGKGGVSSER